METVCRMILSMEIYGKVNMGIVCSFGLLSGK